jgi:glycogen synthase
MDDAVNHPLRVLLLSWEFPPVVGGGLGRHVQGLSTALAEAGHRVTVLTREVSGCAREEYAGTVRVLRLPTAPRTRSRSTTP